MDTISREPSGSPLAIVGVIAGLLALVLSAVALVKVSSSNKQVTDLDAKMTRIDDVDQRLAKVEKMASDTATSHRALFNSAQTEMTKLYNSMSSAEERLTKLETSAPRAPAATAATGGGSNAPAAAGPGEYIIKSGDTFTKIAQANGVTVADIEAANPGVSSNRLQIGQKINIPGNR